MSKNQASLLLFGLLGLAVQPCAAKVNVGKHVKKLSQEKLDLLLQSGDREELLVEFYAPWCHACQGFAPEYSRAAQMIKEDEELKVMVGAVDADKNQDLTRRYGVDSFPRLLFFPNRTDAKPLQYGKMVPRNAEAVVNWVRSMTGPALRPVDDPGAIPEAKAGDLPLIIVRAAEVPPALEAVAQAQRLKATWLWLREAPGAAPDAPAAVVEVRHFQEPSAVFRWRYMGSDDMDDEPEAFEKFIEANQLPRFGRVDKPAHFVKKRQEDAEPIGIIWFLLEPSKSTSHMKLTEALGGGGACSAKSNADGASNETMSSCGAGGSQDSAEEAKERLDAAAGPWRALAAETVEQLWSKKAKVRGKYRSFYVDATRWAKWAEEELSAWNFPLVVVQRLGFTYFFKDGARMPENATELVDFVRSAEQMLSPRRKSQRPPTSASEEGRDYEVLVGDTMLSGLRKAPATLVFAIKSSLDFMTSEERDEMDEDMELFGELATWLRSTCEKPPAAAVIDLRKNELPRSLMYGADFGLFFLPTLYFVHSDGGLEKRAAWGAEVIRYPSQDDTQDFTRMSQTFFTKKDMATIANWTLEQARRVTGLRVPPADVAVSPPQAAGAASKSVEELGVKEFEQLLESGRPALVEFYAPWCGHCKELAPIYASALRRSRRSNGPAKDVAFTKIDGDARDNAKLVSKYSVHSFPTIFFLQGGKMNPYEGGRKSQEIVNWLNTELSPTINEVASQAEAKADGYSVAVWRGPLDSPEYKALGEVAAHWKHSVAFFAIKKTGDESASLTLRKPGASREVRFNGKFSAETVAEWLALELVRSAPIPESQKGAVLELVGRNFNDEVYDKGGEKHFFVELYSPWCKHCEKLEPIYEEFAKRMSKDRDDVAVARLDTTKNDIPVRGFETTGVPTIFYLGLGESAPKKVKERTLDGLLSFVKANAKRVEKAKPKAPKAQPAPTSTGQDFLDQLKSEPVPKEQTSPVLTVVLKNFMNLVFQDKKDVVLEVFSSTCPHCKAFAPKYDKFAERVTKARKNIAVAKIDGPKNDIPFNGFEIKGYPTLFFIPAGEKNPTKSFVGTMAVEQMDKYIEERSGHSEL